MCATPRARRPQAGAAGPCPSLAFIKQALVEAALRRALRFFGRDPQHNLSRLLALGERLAPLQRQKEKVRGARRALASSPALRAYVTALIAGTSPRVQRRLGFNWFVNATLAGAPRQRRMAERLGVSVPHTILVDPTSDCNLSCGGCEAGLVPRHHALDPRRLDRLAVEAKSLGIYWFLISGGEPFLYPGLLDFCATHSDMAFMVYSNGTLVDEAVADRILECGNVSPAFSLEGPRELTDARRGPGVFDGVTRAMDLLRERGVPFGFSLMVTRHNFQTLLADEFIDWLIARGCCYGWTIHYVPVGADPDVDKVVTPAQRAWIARRVSEIREHKPILFADSGNDERFSEGCLAGGRRYFHITARGDVQPCGLVHFTLDNINQRSLVDVLKSPLFRAFQRRQPFAENLWRPCPVFDVPEALREIVAETGARPTYPGADAVLRDEALRGFIDERAAEWRRIADALGTIASASPAPPAPRA